MNPSKAKEDFPKIIAVLSGKGGSGKTMMVALIAHIMAERGARVLIVDADTATAGMTYYLGLNLVANTRVGLSTIVRGWPQSDLKQTIRSSIQRVRQEERTRHMESDIALLGIGDHRRLEREVPESELPEILMQLLAELRQSHEAEWIIVDCRGGIDRESLAVCSEADDVILITESDTTSFQATKHVVDVLSDNDSAHKIRGFMINKVFDNPTVIVSQGTSVFGTQFLSAVPFDLRATRAFLGGNIPSILSPFGRHVWAGLRRAYPEHVSRAPGPIWSFEEYRELGLTNLDSIRGGAFIAALIMITGIVAFLRTARSDPFGIELSSSLQFLLAVFLLGLMGSLESTRRLFGRAVSYVMKFLFGTGRF